MELFERVKRYLKFEKEELKSLAVLVLVLAFIFAFRDFQFTLADFIISLLIVALSVIVHISVQKIFAINSGYNVEFRIWWTGIIITLIISLISYGKFWWIFLPGGITYSLIAGLRLGKFRYGLNYRAMGIIAFLGPISNIVLGTIFKNIELYVLHTPNELLHSIFMFNLIYAVFTMLPIPPLDGHYLFYASRPWYVFLFGTIAVYAFLTLVLGFYSWIWSLVVGGIIVLVYYLSFEKGAWKYI